MAKLAGVDLSVQTVALFGLGDQSRVTRALCQRPATCGEFVISKGAAVVGQWPTEGYEFEQSRAVVDGQFVGLVLDLSNQSQLHRSPAGRLAEADCPGVWFAGVKALPPVQEATSCTVVTCPAPTTSIPRNAERRINTSSVGATALWWRYLATQFGQAFDVAAGGGGKAAGQFVHQRGVKRQAKCSLITAQMRRRSSCWGG